LRGYKGLDTVFIHQIIPSGQAQIKPVGGKEAMRAFIEGHIAGYTSPPKYLGFRDRDFDVEPPETPQLIALHGPKPIWMTYRACLESYFIDAELLHQYWSKSASGPKWKYGPSPSIATFALAAFINSYENRQLLPQINAAYEDGPEPLPQGEARDSPSMAS